jgi:hypothetical protein
MPQRKTIRKKTGLPSTAIESGAMSVMDDDADARYAISIFGEWHSALCSILRVSRACAEADATLSLSDKKGLIAQLPFQKSVFSKLADIGRNHTLQETPILNALPSGLDNAARPHRLVSRGTSPRSFGKCLDATGKPSGTQELDREATG